MAEPTPGTTALVAPDPTGLAGGVVPAPEGRILRPRTEPDAVLVLRFSALGDVMLLAPALAALRSAWPTARIILGVSGHLAPLLAHHPAVTEIVPLGRGEGVFPFAARLRAAVGGASDVAVVDLHGKLRSLALRAILPAGWSRVVWHKRDALDSVAVKFGRRTWRSDRLHADRYHLAVESLVGRALPRGELRGWPDPTDAARAAARLRSAGWDGSRPLVGLSPGARWGTKRWPAVHFAALARSAMEAGNAIVLQGSDDEAALCAEVATLAPGCLNLSGGVDVGTLMGLISHCAAFVANDSGPMHVARALAVPTLAIFGSTDPGMFAWHGHRALFAGLPCAPCSFYGRERCPLGHLRCLTEITPDVAWLALAELLSPKPGSMPRFRPGA